jgi:hypothetical protein
MILYILRAGDVVYVREYSSNTSTRYAMIAPARWVEDSNLCR